MKRVIFIPCNGDTVHTVDVDTEEFADCNNNPYFIAGEVIKTKGSDRVYTTAIGLGAGVNIFVDEDGDWKHLPENLTASYFHRYPLVGNAMMAVLEETGEADIEIVDSPGMLAVVGERLTAWGIDFEL